MIWRRASAQQSIPSLLLSPPSSLPLSFQRTKKKEGTFYYRNISGEEFIFYYSFKNNSKKSPPSEITGVTVLY